MEERQGTNNNITTSFGLQQHEAPLPPPSGEGYHIGPPRSEKPNLSPMGQSNTASVAAAVKASENVAPPFSLTMPVENSSSELKKKRGRPRKYNLDGSLATTLSPMPISSSVRLTSEFGSRKRGRGRGRGRVSGESNNNWLKNPQMFEFHNSPRSGGVPGEFVGPSFTPHVLRVNAGEDVTMKILKFCQQDSRAICVLSANGSISNVTLGQSLTSGGTLTYEGHFEILSLTGLFIPSENGGTRSRAGGMSVSLVGSDGRVFGGGLAGLFIAADPVQVMLGSFIAGREESPQMQKERRDRLGMPTTTQASNISFHGSAEDPNAKYGLNKPAPPMSVPPVSFSHEPNPNTSHGYYANNTANNIKDLFSSLPEEDEEDLEDEDDEEFGGHSDSDTEVPS